VGVQVGVFSSDTGSTLEGAEKGASIMNDRDDRDLVDQKQGHQYTRFDFFLVDFATVCSLLMALAWMIYSTLK
jgi:hypothetical protein